MLNSEGAMLVFKVIKLHWLINKLFLIIIHIMNNFIINYFIKTRVLE